MTHWWWLGFTDETRPRGHRAIGAAIVKAHTPGGAIIIAREEGVVPQGNQVEILHGLVPFDWGDPPPGFAGRRLDAAEAKLLATQWNPDGSGLATQEDIKQAFLDDDAMPGDELFRRRPK